MFSERSLPRICAVTAVALFLTSCDTLKDTAKEQLHEVTNTAQQVAGIATGDNLYITVPGFYEKLNPWIVDQNEFSKFVNKYKNKTELSDKEKADILIQLGIVDIEPNWLTPEGQALIDRYYPGYRKRHADNSSTARVKFAQNIDRSVLSDVPCCSMVVAQAGSVPPPVLLAPPQGLFGAGTLTLAGASGGTLAADAGLTVALGFTAGILGVAVLAMYVYVNKDKIAQILQSKAQDCALVGGCTRVTVNNNVINKDNIDLGDPSNGNNQQFCKLVNQSTTTHPPTETSIPRGRFRFDKKCTYRCADGLVGTVDDTYSLSKECISTVSRSQLGFSPL